MRLKAIVAIAVIVGSFGLVAAPAPASAFGWDRPDQPQYWGREHTVRHWIYRPNYRNQYNYDPYAYRYIPRGYYPYYNSNYWGRPRIHRYHGPFPPYYASWGSKRHGYRHVEWHRRHYGGHRHGNW